MRDRDESIVEMVERIAMVAMVCGEVTVDNTLTSNHSAIDTIDRVFIKVTPKKEISNET